MKRVKQLKKELFVAACSLLVAAVSLSTTTYAWYAMNNTVKATTATISATTNGFVLQIATREEGAQHGGNQKSLSASTVGEKISPSSTDNLKDWYVCSAWDEKGDVFSYVKQDFDTDDDAKPGQYTVAGEKYFAYCVSEYILYTINQTGFADVYLDASEEGPVTVYVDNDETPNSDVVEKSLRIGITIQDADEEGNPVGEESLRVVYAPYEVIGKGNDIEALEDKWTCIGETGTSASLKPVEVTYSHIYGDTYVDQNGKNWAAVKSGNDYTVTGDSLKIAENVDYDGVIMRVYIWMEGTDADCVNNAAAEENPATYSVTVRLAGVNVE